MVICNIYVKLPEGKTIINHPLPSLTLQVSPSCSLVLSLLLQESDIFTSFADLINLDIGCNLSTTDSVDLKEIFERLSELGSWNRKQSAVKSGRWFSWHGCCQEALHEFWSTRLLLQYKYPADNPDERARSFTQMKGDTGGLRLGLMCCAWSTFFGVQVLRLTHKGWL